MIVKDDVQKVLICLARIDQFDQDKDIRAKYKLLQGARPVECGIQPYLTLSDPYIFF